MNTPARILRTASPRLSIEHNALRASGLTTKQRRALFYSIAHEHSTKKIVYKLRISYDAASSQSKNLHRKIQVDFVTEKAPKVFDLGILSC